MSSNQANDAVGPLESDHQRRNEMIRDFKDRLEADTHGRAQIARLLWLFEHLAEYLGRWRAFLTVFSMSGFVHGDLHIVLKIAVDIIQDECRNLSGHDAFRAKVDSFAAAVRSIDAQTDKSISNTLQTLFEDARAELLHIEEEKTAMPDLE